MPLSRVSTPILPSRYDEVLNKRVADHARAILATNRPTPSPLHLPSWAMPALVVGAGMMAAAALLGRDGAGQRAQVPFSKANLVSTGTVGLTASAEDLIAPSPSPRPSSRPEPVVQLLPSGTETSPRADTAGHTHRTARAYRRAPEQPADTPVAAPSPECPTCRPPGLRPAANDGIEPATVILEDVAALYAADVPALARAPERSVTIGTRFRARLSHAAVTSFAGTPITALLQEDLVAGGEVVLPAGTLIVGEAFATTLDDRAQVLFSAIVRDGHTAHFRGVAIGPDSRLGVPGRVVRRASGARKGVGRVLGSLGSALAVGLAGQAPGGVLGDAAGNLAGDLGAEMTQLDRTWATQRSDKAVEVRAGTEILVYVQADMRVK